jgi:DNA-binding LacI/PurR family transcriptional regulator
MSDKPVPLRQAEVARRAGVSPATVSKVINGGTGISPELRSRVLQTMHAR